MPLRASRLRLTACSGRERLPTARFSRSRTRSSPHLELPMRRGMSLADALFGDAVVLVIAPHADDETFGCGGTIARAKSLGARVYVMVVSLAGVDHLRGETAHVCGAQRASEFRSAAEVLGVDGTDVLYTDEQVHLR